MTEIIKLTDLNMKGSRNHFESDIIEMSNSINISGVIQNPIVDENYTVIDGGLRVKGAMKLGLTEIKCEVRTGSEDEISLVKIESNLTRVELSAKDRAVYISEKKEILDRLKVKGSAKVIANENNLTTSMVHKEIKLVDTLESNGLLGVIDEVQNNSEKYLPRKYLDKLNKAPKTQEKMKSGEITTVEEVEESISNEEVQNNADFYNQELIQFFETKVEELKDSLDKNDDKKIQKTLKKILDYTATQTNSTK